MSELTHSTHAMDAARFIYTLLHPLHSLVDAARFFLAAALFPLGLADRALRIARLALPDLPNGEQHVRNLLGRLDGQEAAEELIARLPPADGMVLVPQRDECVACGAPLTIAYPSQPNYPTVYSEDGVIPNVQLFSKRCTRPGCGALHYMSYAAGYGHFGKIPDGKQMFYPDACVARWWQISPSTLWSTKLLRQYQAQALHSHTGAKTFVSEYEMLHGVTVSTYCVQLLIRAFLAWSLVHWLREEKLDVAHVAVQSDESLDAELLAHTPALAKAFASRWGKGHKAHCRQPGNCNCWMLDGHMKCRRPVCANKFARIVECGKLGNAVLGCTHTPMRGSYFCVGCRDAAARGPAHLHGAMGRTSAPLSIECAPCEEQLASSADEDPLIEAGEEDIFVVEELLQARMCTVTNAGDAHRLCARRSFNEYLVKWKGYSSDENCWVCQCNIGKAAITDFNKLAKGKRRSISSESSGDFNISAEERKELKQLKCNTIKDVHGAKRHTSVGILALVASCGLFLVAGEIYGSESLTQVCPPPHHHHHHGLGLGWGEWRRGGNEPLPFDHFLMFVAIRFTSSSIKHFSIGAYERTHLMSLRTMMHAIF